MYQSWGNQYLERSRHKRCSQDLQLDIIDGVLLADIIEASVIPISSSIRLSSLFPTLGTDLNIFSMSCLVMLNFLKLDGEEV